MTSRGSVRAPKYGYDPLGQLINVEYPDGTVVSYNYDAAGNRETVTEDGVPVTYDVNNRNQYEQVGDVVYDYDQDGNMIEKIEANGTRTLYGYSRDNRLILVEVYAPSQPTPSETCQYIYDPLGNRVASIYNGSTTSYVVDPIGYGNVAAEYDDTGTLIARYEHGYGLLARLDPSASGDEDAWYTFSAVGHTSELTNDSGTTLNTYDYDPFGISLAYWETIENPFRYVGEYGVMREAHNHEFSRYRFYDAANGRFVSQDPIGVLGGLNLYRYASNDPLSYSDPLGLMTIGLPGIGEPEKPDWTDLLPTGPKEAANLIRNCREQSSYEECMACCKAIEAAAGVLAKYLVDKIAERQGGNDDDSEDSPLGRFRTAAMYASCIAECSKRWPAKPPPPRTPEAPTVPVKKDERPAGQAVDPNDKQAPGGYGVWGFVQSGSRLPYVVRFENMAEATGPAHIIRVTDILDEDVDLDTFELTEIGYAGQKIVVPEGLDHYEAMVPFAIDEMVDGEHVTGEVLVGINVSLDHATRELTFEMTGLDPATGWLPEDFMQGILYPNDDTGRGEGYIGYTVKPKTDLATGTEITNKATIVFDWNDPIDTPLVLNTIDANVPASEVQPLPADVTDGVVLVEWTGRDDTDGIEGSGVATYDIFVQDNGGDWTLWLDDTADTSAEFSGHGGHTYGFASVATDHVGHEEARASSPDTVTLLQPFVSGRHVFYNNSALDGATLGADPGDDGAIAIDKQPLIPGEMASPPNQTAYAQGLNGIMVDIDGLADAEGLSLATIGDYVAFKAGATGSPSDWSDAPAPIEVAVRDGDGVGDSDRVTFIWADCALQDQWLQVTVKAGAATGLPRDDVFYWGNLRGDIDGTRLVDRDDLALLLEALGTAEPSASDLDRDGHCDRNDLAILLGCYGNRLPVLLPGDVNGDGVVDGSDVQPFVDVLTVGAYHAQADINGDGIVDGLDIQPFVDIITGVGGSAIPGPANSTDATVASRPSGQDTLTVAPLALIGNTSASAVAATAEPVGLPAPLGLRPAEAHAPLLPALSVYKDQTLGLSSDNTLADYQQAYLLDVLGAPASFGTDRRPVPRAGDVGGSVPDPQRLPSLTGQPPAHRPAADRVDVLAAGPAWGGQPSLDAESPAALQLDSALDDLEPLLSMGLDVLGTG